MSLSLRIGPTILLLCLSFLSFSVSASNAHQKRIELDPKTTEQLNTVMAATHQMGLAFVEEDFWHIQQSVEDLLEKIRLARREANTHASDYHRHHVISFLGAAEVHLREVRTSQGEEQKAALREVFHQLAGLLRAFKLDTKYRIIYCGKMNSTWVQEGKTPRSPLHVDVKCGQVVL